MPLRRHLFFLSLFLIVVYLAVLLWVCTYAPGELVARDTPSRKPAGPPPLTLWRAQNIRIVEDRAAGPDTAGAADGAMRRFVIMATEGLVLPSAPP